MNTSFGLSVRIKKTYKYLYFVVIVNITSLILFNSYIRNDTSA